MSFSGRILLQLQTEEESFPQKDQIFTLLLQEILDQLKNSLLISMLIPQQYKDLDGDGWLTTRHLKNLNFTQLQTRIDCLRKELS